MKRILIIACTLLIGINSFSQTPITATADIKSAVVYLQGAEMLLHSTVNVPVGNNDIIFTNLPQNLNASTIQVSANTGITILSAVFQLNYLNSKKENTQVKMLKDSLDLLSNALKKSTAQKQVIKGQMDLLNANKDVSGANTGLSMDQLSKMYDFYSTKMNDLNNQQFEIEQREKKTNESIQRINNQLNEVNSKFNQPTGEIVVSVSSKSPTSSVFEITFLIPDAGWSPVYDIRSKDVKSNVTLNYKANVYQRSGMDWDNVRLKLSTGNPTVSATGPLLAPWYLNFSYPVYNEVIISAPSRAAESNKLYKAEGLAQSAPMEDYDSKSKSGADFTTVTQNQMSVEFDISIPYSIPTSGKPKLISIQDYDLPAQYHYYAVPKLDNDAFLIADISAWEDLNLMPGNANIFFQGSYVGQSYINPASTNDTLPISLGRDKSIVIKREKVKGYSKEKIIGGQKKQSYAYTINIKNTKSESIDIIVLDQYPISQQGKIEVTLDDKGGASLDESTGKLWWNLHLEGNEEKKLKFSFTVKYPKDQIVSGL